MAVAAVRSDSRMILCIHRGLSTKIVVSTYWSSVRQLARPTAPHRRPDRLVAGATGRDLFIIMCIICVHRFLQHSRNAGNRFGVSFFCCGWWFARRRSQAPFSPPRLPPRQGFRLIAFSGVTLSLHVTSRSLRTMLIAAGPPSAVTDPVRFSAGPSRPKYIPFVFREHASGLPNMPLVHFFIMCLKKTEDSPPIIMDEISMRTLCAAWNSIGGEPLVVREGRGNQDTVLVIYIAQ